MTTTGEAVVILNGITYRGDATTRTITPADDTSAAVLDLMETNAPVGPGVDEFAGLTATWDNYPAAMIGAFLTFADFLGVEVTWYSDTGSLPPGIDA